VRFASLSRPAFGDLYGTALWTELQRGPFGIARESSPGERVYFQEYHPYPNELVSWMVAMRVDIRDLSAPFKRIQVGILVFSGLTLGLILLLARVGAHRVAAPIQALGASLTAYADGRRDVRVTPVGPREIRQLQEAFNHMAESMAVAERARDRAQRLMLQAAKLASVGQMAAGIGHEINNPLNHILSLTKLMERGVSGNDAVRTDLASLREEAVRCSRIVAGVLDFARQAPPRYERFEVGPWLAGTLDLVRHSARRAGVSLEARNLDGGSVEGDPHQLRQVLVNVLLNAIQATARGGAVTVEVDTTPECIELRVHDQGEGIPEVVLDQVFDPFFSTKSDGTGLGLSISLGLVERHGGSLRLCNEPGGGVTASIVLPRERQVDSGDCKSQSSLHSV
jgi:two-component system NtrC family sensor kinase